MKLMDEGGTNGQWQCDPFSDPSHLLSRSVLAFRKVLLTEQGGLRQRSKSATRQQVLGPASETCGRPEQPTSHLYRRQIEIGVKFLSGRHP